VFARSKPISGSLRAGRGRSGRWLWPGFGRRIRFWRGFAGRRAIRFGLLDIGVRIWIRSGARWFRRFRIRIEFRWPWIGGRRGRLRRVVGRGFGFGG
jgi:hypothetical protein